MCFFCVSATISPMSTAEVKILEARSQQYRDYPESLKGAVLQAIEANGNNVSATAKLFNIPPQTVDYWWRNCDRYSEIQKPSAQNLADKLENIAIAQADSIASHDLSIVAIRDKAAVMDVAIKNMQLLRGQATSITVDLERTELTVILQSSLSAGLELDEEGPVIDVSCVARNPDIAP